MIKMPKTVLLSFSASKEPKGAMSVLLLGTLYQSLDSDYLLCCLSGQESCLSCTMSAHRKHKKLNGLVRMESVV